MTRITNAGRPISTQSANYKSVNQKNMLLNKWSSGERYLARIAIKKEEEEKRVYPWKAYHKES